MRVGFVVLVRAAVVCGARLSGRVSGSGLRRLSAISVGRGSRLPAISGSGLRRLPDVSGSGLRRLPALSVAACCGR